jgi:3-isopropylmalate/(R)-2-methylmalate dehydratase small subunit
VSGPARILQVAGRSIVMPGSDIDTDRIIPARFLKTVTFEGLERGLFADDRQALRTSGRHHPFDRPEFAGARILIVNKNFGCGSSREHAPQALYRWGIRAIVGESFSEIFFSNALMIGLPCVSLSEPDVAVLMHAVESAPASTVVVDLATDRVTTGPLAFASALPAFAKDALTSGHWDGAGLLLDHYEDVDAFASKLPY